MPDLKDDSFDDIIAQLAKQLYDEKQANGSISDALYNKTAERLTNGMFEGLGAKAFDFDDYRNDLKMHLEHNIYAFSAAKSLTELKHFRGLLLDDSGQKRDFISYRNAVTDAGYVFNVQHLETEYDNVVATVEGIDVWNSFEDDDYIQISTAGDNRVRDAHRLLDKFTAKKSNPVWKRLWPPFDWKCRCHIIPGVQANARRFRTADVLHNARIEKYFQRNPALSKTVFDEGHPYFVDSIGKKHNELTAERNYNMPSAVALYRKEHNFPEVPRLTSKELANKWWTEQSGAPRGNFTMPDYSGSNIEFSDDFRRHIMEDNKDKRHSFLPALKDIISSPDEVWSQKEGGKIKRIYIKYFNDLPYVIKTDGASAFTMYNFGNPDGSLNEPSVIKARRGILLFRKS